MGNAVYKLLTEQARILPISPLKPALIFSWNLSPISGLGENGTPGCHGESGTRTTRAASITTSRYSSKRTNCPDGPFLSDSERCS